MCRPSIAACVANIANQQFMSANNIRAKSCARSGYVFRESASVMQYSLCIMPDAFTKDYTSGHRAKIAPACLQIFILNICVSTLHTTRCMRSDIIWINLFTEYTCVLPTSCSWRKPAWRTGVPLNHKARAPRNRKTKMFTFFPVIRQHH